MTIAAVFNYIGGSDKINLADERRTATSTGNSNNHQPLSDPFTPFVPPDFTSQYVGELPQAEKMNMAVSCFIGNHIFRLLDVLHEYLRAAIEFEERITTESSHLNFERRGVASRSNTEGHIQGDGRDSGRGGTGASRPPALKKKAGRDDERAFVPVPEVIDALLNTTQDCYQLLILMMELDRDYPSLLAIRSFKCRGRTKGEGGGMSRNSSASCASTLLWTSHFQTCFTDQGDLSLLSASSYPLYLPTVSTSPPQHTHTHTHTTHTHNTHTQHTHTPALKRALSATSSDSRRSSAHELGSPVTPKRATSMGSSIVSEGSAVGKDVGESSSKEEIRQQIEKVKEPTSPKRSLKKLRSFRHYKDPLNEQTNDILDCISLVERSMMIDPIVCRCLICMFKDQPMLLHRLLKDYVTVLEALEETMLHLMHPYFLELLSTFCTCNGEAIADNQRYICERFLPLLDEHGFHTIADNAGEDILVRYGSHTEYQSLKTLLTGKTTESGKAGELRALSVSLPLPLSLSLSLCVCVSFSVSVSLSIYLYLSLSFSLLLSLCPSPRPPISLSVPTISLTISL